MKFNIVPEYISCVLLALIGVYMLFDKKTPSIKETTFKFSLGFSFIANVNNIISIYTIENSASVPVLLSIYANTFYYFAVAVMTTMVSITTYVTMFEGRYEERRLKSAISISAVFFILEVAIVLTNLVTGCFILMRTIFIIADRCTQSAFCFLRLRSPTCFCSGSLSGSA